MTAPDDVGPVWVVLEGGDDAPVIDEAHRVADLLGESGARPPVAAIAFEGAAVEAAVEAGRPDEVIRLERASGASGVPGDSDDPGGPTAFDPGAAGLAARVGALAWLADRRPPTAVLAPSGPAGDDLVSRLAPRLGGGCVTDCLVRVRDGEILAGRAVYGGRAYGEVEFEGGPPVVSVDAAALGTPDPRPGGDPETTTLAVPPGALPEAGIDHVATLAIPEQDLSRARSIVAGGRGLGDPDGFETVRNLADALGAALGASRPPADDGWVAYDRQIGVTGKEVDAELYVPCAISGDPYHMRAVDAEHLLAINTDPEARVFEFADLGIVGDVYEYAPVIAEAVRTAKDESASEGGVPGDAADGGTDRAPHGPEPDEGGDGS